jgi:hypothetical protein
MGLIATDVLVAGAARVSPGQRAIARRAQLAGPSNTVRLSPTISVTLEKAERLPTRAIREQENLEAVMAENIEAAE